MLGDEPARIRLVTADRIPQRTQCLFNRFGYHTDAARAVSVAQHELWPWPFVLVTGRRRHRMTIDQHRGTKIAMQTAEKTTQRPVIGLVQAFNALEGIVDRDTLVVDLLGIADHSGHGSKASRYAHRPRIRERWQAAFEHSRIKLIRLAIHVDKTARKMRAHHRVAAAHDACDQIVDKAVFRSAQSGDVQAAGCQKFARIGRSAVRGIEQHRPLAGGGLEYFEWRVELVANFTHA